ncbi:hypothetical protein SDC9_22242 [bioreactor metagenome]|uniref:Redox-active protein n=1 Tax=bioreactor metagenome TaxID=1076179 RepID=A0A644UBV1_9ZZZZ|nr:C-GCAxxG-C-C family protein [Acidaminococcaceae bacterium]
MDVTIKERVHELYWKQDINCARTMLICLCELFDIDIEKQTLNSAIGLHGAGGFRAQCGLVEGALMFIGIYFSDKGKTEADIASICYQYADEFTKRFGSLKCCDLRPDGFSENDPPHACEEITGVAIEFTKEFIKKV